MIGVHALCSELGRLWQHVESVAHAPVAIPLLLPPLEPPLELPPGDPLLPPNPHCVEHFCMTHCSTELWQLMQFASCLPWHP
jgi:hypothetical protein